MRAALCVGLLGACGAEQPLALSADAASHDTSETHDASEEALNALLPLQGCNPVAEAWSCFYPYPSDLFLIGDPSLPSGYRLKLSEEAQPQHVDGGPAEAFRELDQDGASILPQIEVYLPEPIVTEELASHAKVSSGAPTAEGSTLLIDTERGALVPHFAETKPDPGLGDGQLLAIRPLAPLEPSRRYVVALQNLTTVSTGEALSPSPTFKSLRDGEGNDDALQRYYESHVFDALGTLEVPRDTLQLAWSFTTGSDALRTGRMQSIRDQLHAHLSVTPPEVTITEVSESPSGHVARAIRGTIAVPSFVSDAEPTATLVLDAAGTPVMGPPFEVPFVAYIPRSVADDVTLKGPARLLQYGHGFFGSMGETGGYPAEFANEHGFVIIAVDWWGMSEDDRGPLIAAISGPIHETPRFIERTHQGMANALALGYAAKASFLDHDAFKLEGSPSFDPEHLYFLGISQGHILGGVFVALSPLIHRAVLNGGGASLGFIMTRSRSFGIFEFVIDQVLESSQDTQAMLSLLGGALDPIDPASYAAMARARTDLHILMQTGMGDALVPAQSAHLHARGMGLGLLSPAPRELPGFETFEAPYEGSGLVEYDFNLDPDPTDGWTIPDDNEVHEGLRRLGAVKAQMSAFLQPKGRIESTCLGVCDPE